MPSQIGLISLINASTTKHSRLLMWIKKFFQFSKSFHCVFYHRVLRCYMYAGCKRINWKNTYFAVANVKIPRNFYSSSFSVSVSNMCTGNLKRECLYSTIFRLRFIAGLLSSRLSNCSLDFSQPLVFIALSSRTLSPKGASRTVEILLPGVRVYIRVIIKTYVP